MFAKNFNNLEDNNSLFSTLLVNKNWCDNVVIILWRNPFNYDLDLNKMAKMIPVLVSQGTLQQRIELNLQDNPIKTTYDYGWFIQQIDLRILYKLVKRWIKFKSPTIVENHFMVVSKIIFMKTKGLEEFSFSSIDHLDKWSHIRVFKQIFALAKSQMLLNQVTKMKFRNPFVSPSELLSCIKSIKHLSIKFVCFYGKIRSTVKSFFDELIELVSAQKNLEYFNIRIIDNDCSDQYLHRMENWNQTLLALPRSIKYLRIVRSFIREPTDLSFLSRHSNLEELHLDDIVIYDDQIECLKDIYLPKLFSLSILDSFICRKEEWVPFFVDFLRNHRNTLKELKFVYSDTYCFNYDRVYKPIFDTISLYCINLTLIGLKLDHIFGMEINCKYNGGMYSNSYMLNKAKSIFNNCSKLQKIILFADYNRDYKLSKQTMIEFFQILPNSLTFLSFEGIIDNYSLKEILRNYIGNLIILDFYCIGSGRIERDVIDSINEEKGRNLKLRFGKKIIKIKRKEITRCFLDFS